MRGFNRAMALMATITGAFHGMLSKIDHKLGEIIHGPDKQDSGTPDLQPAYRRTRSRMPNSERVGKNWNGRYTRRDTGGPHSEPGARIHKLADEGRIGISPRGCVSRAILNEQAARNRLAIYARNAKRVAAL